MINLIYIIVFLIAVLLAGLFAGAETGVYQLSRLRLRVGIEQKKLSFVLLGKSIKDGAGLLISLLLGANLANYIATMSMTYLILRQVHEEKLAVILTTVISTPVFFVFSELIPKNLFYYRANDLTAAVGPVIYGFDLLARWCGVTPVIKLLGRLYSHTGRSHAAMRSTALTTNLRHFDAILLETHEEGVLSHIQTDMMSRLGHVSQLQVPAVMTPITRIRSVDINSSKKQLLETCRQYPYTRYPVCKQRHGNLTGLIDIYQCLTEDKDYKNLDEFVQPLSHISANTKVMEAIDLMQKEKQKMLAVVRDGHGQKVMGIVTMKDLVEELLGELAEW